MNYKRRHNFKSVLAILFIVTLLTPVWVSLTHELQTHEHPICTTAATHIHNQPVDCNLCDFSLPTSTLVTFEFSPSAILIAIRKADPLFAAGLVKPLVVALSDRAPPVIS